MLLHCIGSKVWISEVQTIAVACRSKRIQCWLLRHCTLLALAFGHPEHSVAFLSFHNKVPRKGLCQSAFLLRILYVAASLREKGLPGAKTSMSCVPVGTHFQRDRDLSAPEQLASFMGVKATQLSKCCLPHPLPLSSQLSVSWEDFFFIFYLSRDKSPRIFQLKLV